MLLCARLRCSELERKVLFAREYLLRQAHGADDAARVAQLPPSLLWQTGSRWSPSGQTSLSLVLQTEDVVWLLGACVCRHCARAVRLGVRPRRPTGVARSSSRRARVRRCTLCSVTPTAQPSMPAAKATSVCTTSTSALSLAQVGMTVFLAALGRRLLTERCRRALLLSSGFFSRYCFCFVH